MRGDDSGDRSEARIAFALVIGLAYLTLGILQVFFGATGASVLFIPADIIGGLVLAVLGLVFLTGFADLADGRRRGLAYLFVGAWLATLFCAIHLIFLAADASASLLAMDGYGEWAFVDGVVPAVYLAIPAMVAILSGWLRGTDPAGGGTGV